MCGIKRVRIMKNKLSFAIAVGLLGLSARAGEAPTNHPMLSVWPPRLNMGQVMLGDSVTNSFTIKNLGGGTVRGSAGILWSSWDRYDPDTVRILDAWYGLGPNESRALRVVYTPSGASNDVKIVNFASSDGMEAIALVIGSSLGTNARPAAVISVTPTSIDFGVVKFGETRTNYITVKNMGGALLRGRAHIGLELTREEMRVAETNALKRRFTPAPFDLISGNTYALGSNESQTVVVTYTPSGLLPTNRALVYFPGEGRRVETRTVTISGASELPDRLDH
jgi:hypothetical protein